MQIEMKNYACNCGLNYWVPWNATAVPCPACSARRLAELERRLAEQVTLDKLQRQLDEQARQIASLMENVKGRP
jgi:DNA-directed RNA polymerase subunit RPC12/RpoP